MSIEVKATLLAVTASLGLLRLIFAFSPLQQSAKGAELKRELPTNSTAISANAAPQREAKRGHDLFERNCAHCHGDDARGDEGPSLYDLKKSDARITKFIKEGIKGEMPTFGKKFEDADVQALIAYLRTLKS